MQKPVKYPRLQADAFIGLNAVEGIPATTGKTIYVHHSGPSYEGYDVLTTIDAGINQARASKSDTVVVMPGHAETITAAAAIALDVAGVTVVGLGEGRNRPVVTISSTDDAGSITQSGNNTKWLNIEIVTNDDGLTNAMVVSGNDCVTEIFHSDTSAAIEAGTIVRGDTADNWTLRIKHRGFIAGNAMVSAVKLDDCDNVSIYIDAYGIVSTAWVEMVDVASTNVTVNGRTYTSGVTNFSRNVVDTITGSIWTAKLLDASAGSEILGSNVAAFADSDVSSVAATATAIAAQLAVPAADVTTNTNERDAIGSKLDAAVSLVGTTKSIMAYVKGLVSILLGGVATDSSSNANMTEVIGSKADASVYVPAATKSLAAYAKGNADLQERVALKAAATITNGQTLFTIAGGPIQIIGLVSICATNNDATASTLQYNSVPTSGSAQTISAASASLANATAGATVALAGTALSTAALLSSNGANLIANPGTVVAPAGTLTAVVAVGSTTGTWAHFLRYRPLAAGVTVS